jgi:hypothetical protein
VPSLDVLKTAKHEYNKKYRLDEDIFKQLRMFRCLTWSLDTDSKKMKGKDSSETIPVVSTNILISSPCQRDLVVHHIFHTWIVF